MTADKPTIGFIGTGLLGGPIVLRLLDQGYRVIVHDIDRAKLAPLSQRGAGTAASPAEVTAAADIVQLCLISTAAVEAVVAGTDGVIETADARKLLVDHSTTETATTKRLAARLEAETGMGWVDAPVSGGPPAAAAGALTIMAGGRAADFERARPVLDAIAGSATRMGEVGAGQVTKMINQILVLNQYCVMAEALKLAEASGIDATKIPQCLAGGYADSRMLAHFFPRMIERLYEPPAGYARQVLKDLDMVHDLAKETKTPTPMSSQAASLYRLLVARGHGEQDAIAIYKLYDEPPI